MYENCKVKEMMKRGYDIPVIACCVPSSECKKDYNKGDFEIACINE